MRRLLPALLATAIVVATCVSGSDGSAETTPVTAPADESAAGGSVSYNARDVLAPMAGELDALIEASRTTEVTVTSK